MSAQFSEEEAAVLRRMIAAFLRVEKRARGVEPPTTDLGPAGTRAEDDPARGRLLCAEGVHAWGWKRGPDRRWLRLCMRCGLADPDTKEGS